MRRQVVPLAILVLGLGLTSAVVWAGQERSTRSAADTMDRLVLFVAEAVSASVAATIDDVQASAGLFAASDHVTEAEFAQFVDTVGQTPGSLGLGYVPLVTVGVATEFWAGIGDADPGFDLFQFDQSGDRVESGHQQTVYPVRYFVAATGSDLDLRGFDGGTDPAWVEVLERASETATPQISRLTQLFGVPGRWGFLATAPIIDGTEVSGFTVAVVPLEALVDGELAESLAEVVVWDVTDITKAAPAAVTPDQLRRAETLHVGGRVWRVEVIPTTAARQDLDGTGVWMGLAMGFSLAILAALVAHLTASGLKHRRETEALSMLTEEKDEFLAAVSHELRTPLTTVVGMAEILEESTLGADPEIREYVSLLRQEGKELARLVEDLLLMGRMDSQVLPMRPESVDLGWEVERIVAEIDRPPKVSVAVVGEGRAWVDPLRLRHVIRHLYTNALRHGGKTVTIHIRVDPHQVRLVVCDDGPGVPEHQVGHLFSATLATKKTPGGPASLGLGLRVSKRLAWVLGGDLTYRRADSLSVFELRLPRVENTDPDTQLGDTRRIVSPART